MADRGCPKCNIVYHMISDSTENPICKKCGGQVLYMNSDRVEYDRVMHDYMWSSINPKPEDIDPDYMPK